MDYNKLTAHELKDLINKKEVKVEEVTQAYLDRINEVDKDLGAFLYVAEKEAIDNAKLLDEKISKGEKIQGLGGVPIGIKDNISVKGMQNTCASKILEGYISPYDAHVIEKIKKNNGIVIGKLNMDEFAMGSSNEKSAYNIVKNPWDTKKVPGGSSGGSAVAVSSEIPLSLGTDTGGSVRQPASFCGVVGLKPTYGRVSRYGLAAVASTLDQIGPMARDVRDCANLTQVIAGVDSKDFTTADISVQDYSKSLSKDIKGKKIGVPKEFFEEDLNDDVRKSIEESIKVFEENGAIVKECSLPNSKYALITYYIISSAEASSNLARFDGIGYGHRTKDASDAIDIYYKSRAEGFGPEVKKRIMLGTYVLLAKNYDFYYKKALKVRNLIKQDFENVFKDFDALISPVSPTTAFNIGEKTDDLLSMCSSYVYTVSTNLAGVPAISVPCGMVEGLPVGLQIMGNYFREDILFNLAYSYEQSTNWHKSLPNL